MARRNAAEKREILPDPKFHNLVVAKFSNILMKSGKKSVAEKIIYSALKLLEEKIKKQKKTDDSDSGGESGTGGARQTAVDFFQQALNNVKPFVEVRSRRVGGATYQVPVEVRPVRSEALAMRWLINAARLRGEKGMVERLTAELFEAYLGRGAAVKKREDTGKMAEANKAFAHFGWSKNKKVS